MKKSYNSKNAQSKKNTKSAKKTDAINKTKSTNPTNSTNNSNNILLTHLTEFRVYYLSALIISAVFILSLIISSRNPFGTLPPLKGDGMEQIFAKHMENIREIKKHVLPWHNTFSTAGFLSMFNYRTYDIMNPWLIIKYSLIDESLILADYIFSLLLNLILSSSAIIFYLTHRSTLCFERKDMRLLPISLLYTLSAYNIIMYSYEIFKYACYLPLIILGMEQMLYRKKHALYISALVMIITYEPYQAFILCEFLALYYLTMHFENVKDFLLKGLRFLASSVIAAGLSAFYLIPYYMIIRSSAYSEQDSHAPSILKSFGSFFTLITDYRALNRMNPVTENESQAAIYAGLIMLFIVPLYVLCREIKLKERIIKISILIILFIAFNNELLNYIMHGFHFQTKVPNRFAIFFVFILITMLGDVVSNIDNLKEKYVCGCIIIPSVLFGILYAAGTDIPTPSKVASIVFLVIYISLAIVFTVSRLGNEKLFHIMLYLSLIEIVINAVYMLPDQMMGTSEIISEAAVIDEITDKHPDMKRFDSLTEYICDNPLYHNIGQMCDINTLTYFASDYTHDIPERMKRYNITTGTNNINYYTGNPLADMMLGVRYHILKDELAADYSRYDKLDSYQGYNIYENPYYVSLGFVIPDNADSVGLTDCKDPLEYQNSIAVSMGGSNIFRKLELNSFNENEPLDEQGSVFAIDSEQYINVDEAYSYVYFHLSDDINGEVYTYIDNDIYYIGRVDSETRSLSFSYSMNELSRMNYKPVIAILDKEAMSSLHDILSTNCLTNTAYENNKISADINCSEDGTLYISLPYYDSWEILIDGQKVEKKRFMGGMGVPVNKGSHDITMRYTTAGATAGIIVSILTVIIILIILTVRFLKIVNSNYEK